MAAVGIYDAKSHLSDLIERALKGEKITITRHGVPMVELVPARSDEQASKRAAVDALRAMKKASPTTEDELREGRTHGRR